MKEIKLSDFISLSAAEKETAPEILYIEGDENLLKLPKVLLIGSKKPSEEGIKRVRRLAKMLVQKGIVIVSGLSPGIATEAHEAAMEFGGKTIAFLGTPFFQYYPAENEDLQTQIEKKHLAVSQFSIGEIPSSRNFPLRDKLMALLTDGTVIIEAKDGSGTIFQGQEALRLKKPLYILKSLAEDPSLHWTEEMLKAGAGILSEENFGEFIGRVSPLR